MHGALVRAASPDMAPETPVACALRARALGFRRLLYTEIRGDDTLRGLNLEVLRLICTQTGLRVTQSGGVTNLQELLSLQELEKAGVDSVVMGRALCENRFACQGLWRVCEAGNYPYTAKV
jgi:phosphoribosylformimino-5-aminoimidazole carboxamide ribotide isomerase